MPLTSSGKIIDCTIYTHRGTLLLTLVHLLTLQEVQLRWIRLRLGELKNLKQINFSNCTNEFSGSQEYPTQRDGEPEDRENFVHLVKELKDMLKPHNLLLTSAIGASKKVIDQAYNVRELSKYLDFLHIMCYDYGGNWDRKITANAPLHSDDDLNVETTI